MDDAINSRPKVCYLINYLNEYQEVDEIVQSLHDNYEEQWKKVGKLSTALALIPQVIHGVQEVCDTILNLQCAFDETEDALLTLEDMIETQELREKQLDHRF